MQPNASAVRLERFGLEFFAVDREAPFDLADAIPLFHRWIQSESASGLLVDVVDYRHVSDGPGVLLIGHEADHILGRTENRFGLRYNVKRPADGSNSDRLRSALKCALNACRLLEEEPELERRGLKFRGEEFRLLLNDRLAAPNETATLEGLRPDLEAVLGLLYSGRSSRIEPAGSDPRDRFALDIENAEAVDVGTLLQRLEPG